MWACPCPTGSAGTPCAAGSAPAASRRCGWPTTSSSTRRWRSRCSPTTGPRTTRSGSGSSRRAATCARSSRRTSSPSTTPASSTTGVPTWSCRTPTRARWPTGSTVEGLTHGAGHGGGAPDRCGAPGAARPRHPAPRRQAGQRAVPQRRRRRGSHRARDGRRPRPRQVARHVLAADDDRRHPDVRRPRAGRGTGPRRARRPVLPGRTGLPAADRPTAVHPPLAVRRDEPGDLPPVSTTGAAVSAGRRGGAAPRAGSPARRPLPERHRVRRCAGGGPWPGCDRSDQPAVARPRPRAHPARPAADAQPEVEELPEPALPQAERPSAGRVVAGRPGGAGRRRGRRVRRPAAARPTERTVTDVTGTITVTVPAEWDRADAGDGWVPPNAGGESFPALSVGTSEDWAGDAPPATASSWGC